VDHQDLIQLDTGIATIIKPQAVQKPPEEDNLEVEFNVVDHPPRLHASCSSRVPQGTPKIALPARIQPSWIKPDLINKCDHCCQGSPPACLFAPSRCGKPRTSTRCVLHFPNNNQALCGRHDLGTRHEHYGKMKR